MAASSATTAAHLLLSTILSRPLRLCAAAYTSSFSPLRPYHCPKVSFSNTRSFSFSSSLPVRPAISTAQSQAESGVEERDDELDELEEHQEEIEKGDESESKSSGIAGWIGPEREVPKLTVKEKKELGSYANSLGDKLKSQQVGKSGVTNNVVFALSETLEANELLKLKIHRSCPGELEDVVSLLERATGSVAVFQIGRTVIFYRPSITKLKAEEKKEQARRLFAQKRKKAQAAFMMGRKEQWRRRGRGQNGGRRFEKAPS